MRYDFPAPTPRPRSRRTKRIVRWFGLNVAPTESTPAAPDLSPLLPAPGQITLISGPSGAGKSSLLRALQKQFDAMNWIDLATIDLPPRPVVDCFGRRCSIERALSLLSRVGLAEAWTYLRTADELSDGQRWRLRLALAMWKAKNRNEVNRPPILVADEFAALLDRVTACVVAHALRRSVNLSRNLRAVVATSHDDLANALSPDVQVYCDFGSVSVVCRALSA